MCAARQTVPAGGDKHPIDPLSGTRTPDGHDRTAAGGPSDVLRRHALRQTFSGYYSLLYRPIANHMECSSFRMWGGLSGEEYVDLMLAVIRRCGILLADLTTLNPNVIYEVGVCPRPQEEGRPAVPEP